MTELPLFAPLEGWLTPLADVSDPVFADGMMGPGVAFEPLGDCLHAPCDARVLTIHAARHAITLGAAGGVELLLHIGIDSVAMNGTGFEALVAAGDTVQVGQPLIRFDLDRLVQGASAATTPLIVTAGGTIDMDVAQRAIAIGERVALVRITREATREAVGAVRSRGLSIGLRHGLHARPAARLVAALRPLDAAVTFIAGDHRAGGDSITNLLGLGLGHDSELRVEARGPDAEAALDIVGRFLAGEDDDGPVRSPARVAAIDLPHGALAAVPASPGVAIGPIHRQSPVPRPSEGRDTERASLSRALAGVRHSLDAAASGGSHAGTVFAAHRALVDDPVLEAAMISRIDDGAAAAAAAIAVTAAEAERLRALPDPRIAERAGDLIDLGERIAHAALGSDGADVAPTAGVIVVADDLLPSQLPPLAAARIAGIALVRGGPTAHVAILAAGAGLPMVVAAGEALDAMADGTRLLLDADNGYVWADPPEDRVAVAAAKVVAPVRHDPVTTCDGTPVAVLANLATAEDAVAATAAGADGCGLLRTELLFLDRLTPPEAAEQTALYAAVHEGLGGRPLTIRLLDVGGDKAAPYLDLPIEENPALGLRGVRALLARRDVLDAQLDAILSLPTLGALRIMVPMVASAGELIEVREALDRRAAYLGVERPQLGAMVETPAAAIGADLIGGVADFLSIGSNDLTQYALAMDRGNPALASGIDGLHPAVLRLVAETCARGGVPTGVCGGLAADALAVPILIGLGIRSLSVPPAWIAAIKALVTRISLADAARHARDCLDCRSASEVRSVARGFAEEYCS